MLSNTGFDAPPKILLDGAKMCSWALFIHFSPMYNHIFTDIANKLYEAKLSDWGPQDICDSWSFKSHGT